MRQCWALLALSGLAGVAHAQQTTETAAVASARTHLSVSAHADTLDRGYDDWRGVRIELGNEMRGKAGGHLALFEERRFGTRDQGVEVAATLPLGRGWLLVPQLSIAPDAVFLPRGAADINLYREAGKGWVVSAGLGHSAYQTAHVNRVKAGLERYVGAWRVAYQATASHVLGRTGLAHDLRIARTYGDAGEVGVQLNAGREPTLLAQGIVSAGVNGMGVFGRHALNSHWTLRWQAGSTRQGDFYTRRGIGVGVQYDY